MRRTSRPRSNGIERRAIGLVADLSRPESFDVAIGRMRAELDAPDVAIFNQPTPPPGSFLDLGDNLFAQSFNDLLLCFMRMVRCVYPAMAERRWGRIVTLGATVIKQPAPGALCFDYALANIARVAAASAIETIAAELAGHNITGNTIATGLIDTDSAQLFFGDMAARNGIAEGEFMTLLGRQTPVGRIGSPDEMAGLAAYLCSNRAGFTTGEVISCDGGFANSTL